MNSTVAESPVPLGVKAGLRRRPWVYAICRDVGYLGYALRLGLWRAVLGLPDRVVSLGRQKIVTWDVPFPKLSSAEQLADWLQARDIQIHQGRYTLYIPPQDRLEDVLPAVVRFYPSNSGFKILKNLQHPLRANYLYGRSEIQAVRARLTGTPQDQLITANYLHALGIGPRAWDVCCWFAEGTHYSVFVVDHVAGRIASDRECADFLANLKEYTQSSFLRIPVPAWETKKDFRNPDCAGNLLVSPAWSFPQYVDFQNFRLRHPSDWTRRVLHAKRELEQTSGTAAYGQTDSPRRRGWSDAQEIEEINKRWEFIEASLKRCEISVQDRLVLEASCGEGGMLQRALASGASWALGWEDSSCAVYAKPMLFSLGTTRFHITSARLQPGGFLEEDEIPENMRPLLNEAVLLCPSAAADSGMLQSLGRLPWRALVCHGHSAECEENLLGRLRQIDPQGLRCEASAALPQRNSQPWRVAVVLRDQPRAAETSRQQFPCQSSPSNRPGGDV